jgi:hypothetical protein
MDTTDKPEKTDYYVYIYLDPRKPGTFIYEDLIYLFEPFYVGSGRGYRKYSHLYETDMKHKNKPKYNKIKKIKKLGLKLILIEIVSNLTKEKSLIIETNIITKIGRNNIKTGPLLNYKSSEEDCQYEYMKKFRGKGNPMYGKTIFDIWIKKYGETVAAKMIEEYKLKMKESSSGNKNGMYGILRYGEKNPNFGKGKCVLQCDSNDNVIKEWINVPEAARNLKPNKKIISVCGNIYGAIRKGTFAYKFKWKYK